jgi:hypothetical protein
MMRKIKIGALLLFSFGNLFSQEAYEFTKNEEAEINALADTFFKRGFQGLRFWVRRSENLKAGSWLADATDDESVFNARDKIKSGKAIYISLLRLWKDAKFRLESDDLLDDVNSLSQARDGLESVAGAMEEFAIGVYGARTVPSKNRFSIKTWAKPSSVGIDTLKLLVKHDDPTLSSMEVKAVEQLEKMRTVLKSKGSVDSVGSDGNSSTNFDSVLSEESLEDVGKAKLFRFDAGSGTAMHKAAKGYVDRIAGASGLSELEAKRAFLAFLLSVEKKFPEVLEAMSLEGEKAMPKTGGLGSNISKFYAEVKKYKTEIGGVELSVDECRMAIEALEKEIQGRGFAEALEVFRKKEPNNAPRLRAPNNGRDAIMPQNNGEFDTDDDDYYDDNDGSESESEDDK